MDYSKMTKSEMIDRRHELFDVLKYQRLHKPSFLSAGERTCIHGERAALSRKIDGIERKNEYQLPEKVAKKVDEIQHWMATDSKPI